MGRQEVLSMDEKLGAVIAGRLPGVNVSELCRNLGIARQTFYKYRRRHAAEGVDGLVERSRRPLHSPLLIDAALEDEIVRLRKTLELDNGAAHIRDHLARAGVDPLPAVSTIHRALRRRGLVTDQPHKRPHSSWTRFEWPQPNDLWQIDATRWVIARGKVTWIMDVLDDHSRLVPAARAHAAAAPTGEAAFDAFTSAVAVCGLPCRTLTDNGTCFKARVRGLSAFEASLASLGVQHIFSSPFHPQTCGKIERFHQTLKRWLKQQRLARGIGELQDQLDTFLDFYNHRRPHRALGGATPAERFASGEKAAPTQLRDEGVEVRELKVASNGCVYWRPFVVHVGVEWSGVHTTVIKHGHEMWIFGPNEMIRRLTINRTQSYQGAGTRRGGPRRIRRAGPCS
jgi:transposase InsO family protein